jgi:hypothetical protein
MDRNSRPIRRKSEIDRQAQNADHDRDIKTAAERGMEDSRSQAYLTDRDPGDEETPSRSTAEMNR